jgi:hypothetical protein
VIFPLELHPSDRSTSVTKTSRKQKGPPMAWLASLQTLSPIEWELRIHGRKSGISDPADFATTRTPIRTVFVSYRGKNFASGSCSNDQNLSYNLVVWRK